MIHQTGFGEPSKGAPHGSEIIAGRDEPFRSAIRAHLKGHTQGLEDLAIEMLARGLPVRDIEDAFKDENGRRLLSRTAVSQLGEWLWEDYQAFAQRDLSEYESTYLFVDGIAERLRAGAKREPAAREKAVRVIEKLRGLRLTRAAELVEVAAEKS